MDQVAAVLEKVIRRLPAGKRIKSQMLIDAWPEVAGQKIAERTSPVYIDNGILFVWVKDSVWAHHLSLHKKQLITALNQRVKTRLLKDLRFQVGGKPPVKPPEKSGATNVEAWRDLTLNETDLAAVENAFLDVNLAPELAEVLRSLLISQKKKYRWLAEQGCKPCVFCGVPVVPECHGNCCDYCRVKR